MALVVAAVGLLAAPLPLLDVYDDANSRGGQTPGASAMELDAGVAEAPRAPLHFEQHEPGGNSADSRAFWMRGANYQARIDAAGVEFNLPQGGRVPLVFVGADLNDLEGSEPLASTSNYLIGDPREHRTGVPHVGEVWARSAYPGIDVRFYGTPSGDLEYDFIVAPGADPGQIVLSFGESVPELLDGDLVLSGPGGELVQPAPYTYQVKDGASQEVESAFKIRGDGTVVFTLGNYDQNRDLVIDPRIEWSTFHGGSGNDYLTAVAVGSDDSIFVSGYTTSGDFPMAHSRPNGYSDAVVSKFSPDGQLIWSTYIGGASHDVANDLDVLGLTPYIVGKTASRDFPVASAHQSRLAGGYDAFVARLSADGTQILYATFLGGGFDDIAHAIDVAADGSALVGGQTRSFNFPTTAGAFDTEKETFALDGFVARLSSAGALDYGTYFGGASDDEVLDVVFGGRGDAWITGYTQSTVVGGFPVVNAYQPFAVGAREAFVARLDSSGSSVLQSTFLGGGNNDEGRVILLDALGRVVVAGYSQSPDFPMQDEVQRITGSSSQYPGFVTVFNRLGTDLVFSSGFTRYTGSLVTSAAIDGDGDLHIAGYSSADPSTFPQVRRTQWTREGSAFDGFYAKIDLSGPDGLPAVVHSSFVGGRSTDHIWGLALDSQGRVIVAGESYSHDLPVKNAQQPTRAGSWDGFLMAIDECVESTAASVDLALQGNEGDNGWYRTYVITEFIVDTPCPPGVAFASLDGGSHEAHRRLVISDDGEHTLDYYATDASDILEFGERAGRPGSATFKLDATAPLTTAALSGMEGSGGWWRGPVTVDLSATDATSGVATTFYELDGALARIGDSVVVSGDGVHTLSYYTKDLAGNVERAKSIEISIDATAPRIDLLSPREGYAYVLGDEAPAEGLPMTIVVGDVMVHADAADATSGIGRVEFWADGSLVALMALDGDYQALWEASLSHLGEHAIEVVAYDAAGNSASDSLAGIMSLPTTMTGVESTAQGV